ncbi:MAG: PEPxxWA-CTERM sorting domain-containing protein [Caulobacterales bacterium]|nr:PEPxxWA-CTERM sorting domain-containing protein [Caulobacterales bacterium]
MSKLKFAMAMVAAGGAAGGASDAAAAVTIETFNYAGPTDGTTFGYDITLAGAAAPQFRYAGGVGVVFDGGGPTLGVKHTLGAVDGTARLSSTPYSTFSLPNSGETFDSTSVKTYQQAAFLPTSAGDTYYHLTFDAQGANYLGTAKITGDHTLESIAYTPNDAVPEPESWALLILGAGLAGAALRHQRGRQQASTAR